MDTAFHPKAEPFQSDRTIAGRVHRSLSFKVEEMVVLQDGDRLVAERRLGTVLAGMQGGSDVVTGGWSTTIKFERIRVLVNLEMRRVPIGYALLRG